jgi:hypothetical protein
MSLAERLMADLKDAMRAQDVVTRDTIRMARTAIQYAAIELQREPTEPEVLDLLLREVKRRKESIELFRQGKREDLVSAEEAEIRVLERYLPKQLSRDEIVVAVKEIANELGITSLAQMGSLMREAMLRLKGEADGKVVSEVARELLS